MNARVKKLTVVAHYLMYNSLKHSQSSLDIKNIGECFVNESFESCKRENCRCLPHVCFNSFKRLRLKIAKCIDYKVSKSDKDIIYFVTDYDIPKKNPIVVCMKLLGYPRNYILEWANESKFELMVLKNLEFFAGVFHGKDFKISWKTLNSEALENKEKFAMLTLENLGIMIQNKYGVKKFEL